MARRVFIIAHAALATLACSVTIDNHSVLAVASEAGGGLADATHGSDAGMVQDDGGAGDGAAADGKPPDLCPSGGIKDLEFLAFVDDDGNGVSHDDAPRTLRLSDAFACNRPGTRILMINAAAGWCDPCQRESAALPAFAAEYGPRGVAIMTAIFQDQAGDPADQEFVHLWAETFSLSTPVLIDSKFLTERFIDVSAMPVNIFVDAETAEILTTATGADTGDDPLARYRDLLDSYLD
ncbi:MAG: hypothetical protein AABZ30_15400 [Myxococcota bacterium]